VFGCVAAFIGWLCVKYSEHQLLQAGFYIASGFLIGGTFLLNPSWAPTLQEIRGWNFNGMNIMLAVFCWTAAATWYEGLKSATAENAYHYLRTQAWGWLAGFSAPLWSLHGTKVWGIGLILIGLAVIVSLRMGKDGRKVAIALAGVGAVGFCVEAASWAAPYADVKWGGVAVFLVLAVCSGGYAIITVFHKHEEHYHPWMGPAAIVTCICSLALTIGTAATGPIESGGNQVTTTAVEHTHPGDYGNPLDLIARAINSKLSATAARK